MKKKNHIGITLDSQEPGGYSKFPWYALRENYCSAVEEVGGLALPLSHHLENVEAYVALLDALVITGGAFDVSPDLYGSTRSHPSVKVNTKRTSFEWQLLHKALEKNIPILGICGGMQLMNVYFGGTLMQHIPDEFETSIPHEQPNPRNEASHGVLIQEKTLLSRLLASSDILVNSAHHQAVKAVGKDIIVNAFATDGIIEGIEHQDHRFCLGVQWHPEFLITKADRRLFEAFIQEASSSLHKKAG